MVKQPMLYVIDILQRLHLRDKISVKYILKPM